MLGVLLTFLFCFVHLVFNTGLPYVAKDLADPPE